MPKPWAERKAAQQTRADRKRAAERGETFTFAEIEDVLDLVANEEWPDGSFSDADCLLWELIRNKLGLSFR